MIKYFVLDTNILLHTKDALEAFGDNVVVLPMTVIEELDRFKSHSNELGRNSRATIRHIDKLINEEKERAWDENRKPYNLVDGIKNKAGGKIMVLIDKELPAIASLGVNVNDNYILRAAYHLMEKNNRVIFVTKDLNLRIKADIVNIETQDWIKDKINIYDFYKGYKEINVNIEKINELNTLNTLEIKNISLLPNEFLNLKDLNNQKHSVLAKAKTENTVKNVNKEWNHAYGIKAKNIQQKIALQILLDNQIKLVSLVGTAGTGKTLIALAAALEMLEKYHEERKNNQGNNIYRYEKITVYRAVQNKEKIHGRSENEDKNNKIKTWMKPVIDNLVYLIQNYNKIKNANYIEKNPEKKIKKWIDEGIIELNPIGDISGRAINNQLLIIEDAQNLTPHEIKTIITKVGRDAKVILTGDNYQVDNPYLDPESNGLSYIVEKMKNQKIFAHVMLRKTERSELAEIVHTDI